jgi:hypothetical protein
MTPAATLSRWRRDGRSPASSAASGDASLRLSGSTRAGSSFTSDVAGAIRIDGGGGRRIARTITPQSYHHPRTLSESLARMRRGSDGSSAGSFHSRGQRRSR